MLSWVGEEELLRDRAGDRIDASLDHRETKQMIEGLVWRWRQRLWKQKMTQ